MCNAQGCWVSAEGRYLPVNPVGNTVRQKWVSDIKMSEMSEIA